MADPFEIVEHPADVGFRAWGSTPADLFANSALALMSIAAEPDTVNGSEERAITVSGHDYESVLVNWLEEILYLFDSAQFAAREFRVDAISTVAVSGRLIGEPRDSARHTWKVIVKAVTYHGIEVAERNGQWQSRVFVDV
jgi:SHS2 domain-containing protein